MVQYRDIITVNKLIRNSICPSNRTNTSTLSGFEVAYTVCNLYYIPKSRKCRLEHIKYDTCMNRKVHEFCNFNCIIENEELIKVTSSRSHTLQQWYYL